MDQLPSQRITRAVADVLVVALVLGAFAADGPWERTGPPAWQWVVVAVLTAGVLLFRRRSPLAAMIAIVALWLAVHTPDAAHDPGFQFISLLVGTYALGAHAPRWQAIAGLMLAVAGFSAMNLTRGEEIVAAVAGTIQFSIMFVFGVLLGGRERPRAGVARAGSALGGRARRASTLRGRS